MRITIARQASVLSIASNDRLFLGDGLFETIKVVDKKPCYALLHWQRMSRAANYLGIAFNLSPDDWITHLHQSIEQARLNQGGIKVLLTAGEAPRGLGAKGTNPHLIITVFNYSARIAPLILHKALWQRDSNNPIYRIKSINYLEAILAYRHAQQHGADDALFFNHQQEALETTHANIFLIKDNQLFTPPLSAGILPGIVRNRLLALWPNCREQPLTEPMVYKADGLFLTNTLQGIQVVRAIDKHGYTSHTSSVLASLKDCLNHDPLLHRS